MRSETPNGRGVTLEKLMGDLKIVLQDGEEILKSGAGQLRDKVVAGAQATDQHIRRNPYAGIGVVFGVGLLLGILTFNLVTSGAGRWEHD